MSDKFEKWDFVKFKIFAADEDGSRTDEVLDEGEAQIVEITVNGSLILDNATGLIALAEECEKIRPKVKGRWEISCDIECPKCGHNNDFMDIDEWFTMSQPGETKTFSKSEEFSCRKCGFQMLIEGVEY